MRQAGQCTHGPPFNTLRDTSPLDAERRA